LDRPQAMAMLKELVAHNLVEPSYVNICLRKPDHYQLQLKSDFNTKEIKEFAEKNGLTIEEDKERKYMFIFKR
jgi:hypothetical protein